MTDLPYGIQHKGQLVDLLGDGVPAWLAMLEPGGVLAFSWDATRHTRDEMIEMLFIAAPQLKPRNDGPYLQLGHVVDRVIKQRDVIVAALA